MAEGGNFFEYKISGQIWKIVLKTITQFNLQGVR